MEAASCSADFFDDAAASSAAPGMMPRSSFLILLCSAAFLVATAVVGRPFFWLASISASFDTASARSLAIFSAFSPASCSSAAASSMALPLCAA